MADSEMGTQRRTRISKYSPLSLIPINTRSFSRSTGRLLTAQSRKREAPSFTSEFARLRTVHFIYFTSNNVRFSNLVFAR